MRWDDGTWQGEADLPAGFPLLARADGSEVRTPSGIQGTIVAGSLAGGCGSVPAGLPTPEAGDVVVVCSGVLYGQLARAGFWTASFGPGVSLVVVRFEGPLVVRVRYGQSEVLTTVDALRLAAGC